MSFQQYDWSAALTPVRVAAVTNVAGTYFNGSLNNGLGATLTVTGTSLTIDGVSVAVGDRVLLAGQTSALQNGVYVVLSIGTNVVLQRAADMQSIEQYKAGMFAPVAAGTAYAGSCFFLTETLPATLGVSSQVWSQTHLGASLAYTTLTAAQFNGMYAAPVQILAAPAANTINVLERAYMVQVYGTTQFAAGGAVAFQYENTVHGAGVAASGTVAAASFTGAAASTIFTFSQPASIVFAATVAQPIYLSNATAAFTTGDSTFNVWMFYRNIYA